MRRSASSDLAHGFADLAAHSFGRVGVAAVLIVVHVSLTFRGCQNTDYGTP